MVRARASRALAILLCGGAAAALLACDTGASDPADGDALGAAPDADALDAAPGADALDAGLDAEADDLAEPGSPGLGAGCLIRPAGAGFASISLTPARALGVIDLEAAVSAAGIDGTIGVGRGGAARVRLAGAVRLVPGSSIGVRDGGGFHADAAVPVEAGQTYPIRLVADVASRAYSVYVQAGGDTIRLARRYAIRLPPGRAVLDTLSARAAGRGGQLEVCAIFADTPAAVAYAREGSYSVAPLPGEQAIASDRVGRTWRLGPAGEVLAAAPCGGEVAADVAGGVAVGVYVARVSGGRLALHALTPGLAPRWRRVDPAVPGAAVQAIAADAAGVTVALGAAGGAVSIRRYPADGGAGRVVHAGGALAALGRDGFAVAATWPGWIAVSRHDRGGAVRWYRVFHDDATAEVMALGPDGRVVLGGHFARPISFGGPTLEPAPVDEVDVNSYAVALAAADGAHVFTARVPTTRLTGAAAGAGRVVIASETWVSLSAHPISHLSFPHLWELDAAGDSVPGEPYVGFHEEWGRSGRVTAGASGRVYWERAMVWPAPSSPPFPYLLAIGP